jgi:glutamyl-tRNA synthetase
MSLANPAADGGANARPVRTRFAPSPTGFLHVGAFRTALFSWLWAKKHGGQFLLRVEDTDQGRLVPGSLQNIIQSLRALGMMYDEGPDRASVARLNADHYGAVDPALLPEHGGEYGPYFQSQRLARYDEVLEQLLEEGSAYYAFETPEELDGMRAAAEARRIPYRYSRHYRDYPLGEARDRVAKGEPAVIRLKMPITGVIPVKDYLRGETLWDAETQDDFIIRKADGFPPYHLAAIVDDHDMQISHVLRGEEWQPSFPKHVALYDALGWEQPVWCHVPNVLGPDKKKLAKRHGAKPLYGPAPEYKEGKPTGGVLTGLVNQDGFPQEALLNFLALVGWSTKDNTEVMSLEEILRRFDLEGISPSPGILDFEKLVWMCGVYIREMSPEDLTARSLPFLEAAGLIPEQPSPEERQYIAAVVPLEQEKYRTLGPARYPQKDENQPPVPVPNVPEAVDFFFTDLPEYREKSVDKLLRKDPEGMARFLNALADALDATEAWNIAEVEATTRRVGAEFGLEKGGLTHPVRVALSGREEGPGLFDMIAVLGRERVGQRLRHAGRLATGAESARA